MRYHTVFWHSPTTRQNRSKDEVRRGIEAQRRALPEKLESERRVAQEMEIAKQVPERRFAQILQRSDEELNRYKGRNGENSARRH